jgi:hypothetical protein
MVRVTRPVVRVLLLALMFHLALGAAAECVSICGDEDGGRDCATDCCRAASPFVMDAVCAKAVLEPGGSVPLDPAGSVSAAFSREILHIPRRTLT